MTAHKLTRCLCLNNHTIMRLLIRVSDGTVITDADAIDTLREQVKAELRKSLLPQCLYCGVTCDLWRFEVSDVDDDWDAAVARFEHDYVAPIFNELHHERFLRHLRN